MIMHSIKRLTILVAFFMVSSCGTIARKEEWKSTKKPIFMSSKTDFQLIQNPFKDFGYSYFGGYTKVSKFSSIPILSIWDIGLLLDLPISVIVDAVCLPEDLKKSSNNNQGEL